jgi:hypothetical protein
MPLIKVRGETAKWLLSNISKCIDQLDGAGSIRRLKGEERYQAELRLIAFLKAAMY